MTWTWWPVSGLCFVLYVSDMLLRLGVDLLLVHTPAPHMSTISTCTYTQTFPLHVARLWLPAPVVLDCSQYLLGLCIQKAFVCSLASALTLPSSSASVTRPFLRTRTSTTSHYQHSINKLWQSPSPSSASVAHTGLSSLVGNIHVQPLDRISK